MAKKKQTQGEPDEPLIYADYRQLEERTNNIDGSLADYGMKSEKPEMHKQTKFPLVRPDPKPVARQRAALPVETHIEHILDVKPSAIQVVQVKTNAVDRAKGHLIVTVPMFLFVGFVIDLLVYQFVDYPLLSITSVLILSGAAVLGWFVTWLYTLSITAEAVSKYEAKRKWDVVDREQKNRWKHYARNDKEE